MTVPSTNGPGPFHKVRERRRFVGLTQQSLADAVGVSRQTVISMETADYAPSVYLALKVAAALDTTVETLWGTEATDARVSNGPTKKVLPGAETPPSPQRRNDPEQLV